MNRAGRQQILASYAVLAALLIVLVVVIILPPIDRRLESLNGIEASREIFAKANEAIAENQAAVANETGQIDETALLRADTDALAAAELQQTITAIVDAEGASLVSTAFRRDDEPLPLVRVPVAVRLRSSVESLLGILQTLEANKPRLYVSDLAIQSRHGPGRTPRDLQEELDVQFDVVGYLAPAEQLP